MLNQINKIVIAVFLVVSVTFGIVTKTFAVFSCSITTALGCTNTIVLRMSSQTNAHAEMPNQSTSNYSNNVICCSGLSGTSCTGNTASVLKLSSTTNAHVELATNNNYTNTACVTSTEGGPLIGYQDNNCTGYDTTLASISSTTNATIGNASNYTKKICGSLTPFSISFTISTTTTYFGNLNSVATTYASSTNENGDTSQTEAHNFAVKTNAPNGYSVSVQGASLTSGGNVITPIGNSNTAPIIGVEQFGVRLVSSGGIGSVSSPYAASGFAYAASATTSSQVASAVIGDNATTTYSVRYMANLAGISKPGSYIANVVYVVTANF